MSQDASRLTVLPNGLRVVTEAMPRVETASVGVWVDAGTRHEDEPVNGVAHLIEHMAFKGTSRRSARRIAEEIEDVGGSLNAYTSREQTAYYARVLADDVPLGLDMIADILQHSTFVEDELEKERHVVLQEIGEVMDNPSDLIFDLFQERAYPDQPIGRSILGPEDVVATMPREALLEFIDRHYTPERMIVAASGRVDHERIVDLAQGLFTGLPAKTAPQPEPARYLGGEHLVERPLEQVHVCLGLEAFSFHDPDFYALQVFSAALGGGMSSRLFQEVRENRGLCYSVFSFTSLHKDSGVFGVYAGTGEEEVAELMPVLCDEMRRMSEDIEQGELDRARAQMKAGLLMSLEGCFSVCEDLARQHLTFGEHLPAAEIARRIEAVDRAAIERVGRRLFERPVPTLTAIGPGRSLPDLGSIRLGAG